MAFHRTIAAFLVIAGINISAAVAQKPDSEAIKYQMQEWYNVFIKTSDGSEINGYMEMHKQYLPMTKLPVLRMKDNKPVIEKLKVEDVETVEYATVRYVKLSPDEYKGDIMARETALGKLNLYTYTELKSTPAPIPVPGAVRVIAVPHNETSYFIGKNYAITKLKRSEFKEHILEFVGENQQLAEKINDKTYKYKDTETIIKAYNAWAAANK